MNLKICARCKQRPAVIFITRMEKDQTINEGICLKCAKELGLKPVDDIMEKMGISDEDLERMDMEMKEMMSDEDLPVSTDDEEAGSHTPPIDFRKLFGGLSMSMPDDFIYPYHNTIKKRIKNGSIFRCIAEILPTKPETVNLEKSSEGIGNLSGWWRFSAVTRKTIPV